MKSHETTRLDILRGWKWLGIGWKWGLLVVEQLTIIPWPRDAQRFRLPYKLPTKCCHSDEVERVSTSLMWFAPIFKEKHEKFLNLYMSSWHEWRTLILGVSSCRGRIVPPHGSKDRPGGCRARSSANGTESTWCLEIFKAGCGTGDPGSELKTLGWCPEMWMIYLNIFWICNICWMNRSMTNCFWGDSCEREGIDWGYIR